MGFLQFHTASKELVHMKLGIIYSILVVGSQAVIKQLKKDIL